MFEILEFSTTTVVLLVTIFFCWFVSCSAKKQKNRNAPPSLPHLPVVGSLPFLSGLSKLHVCLAEKCKKYGKIFSMYAGSRYVVVLSGYDLIREALINNSLEYSGRGDVYVEKHVWSDHGKGVIVRPASDGQRKVRSNCLTVMKNFGFGSRGVMEQRIQEEVFQLLQYVRSLAGIAWYPSHILEHATMNVINNLMFGRRFRYDDQLGQELRISIHNLVESADPALDIFPILTRLPYIKRKMAAFSKIHHNFLKFWESQIEESISGADMENDNFVNEYRRIVGAEAFDKRDMAVIIRDLMAAGTETTSGQLNWALILLANHPGIQSRLQQEIDSVVPRDRLPSLDDKPRLSYLEAVMLEVFRFRAAAPLAVPHRTLADTVVGGFNIPAGTEVLINIWAAQMDQNVWNEPQKFKPERFLDESESICNRDHLIAFSLGKRSCLGEILARQEMFLFLSALVQRFHILPPEGEVKVKDGMCFGRTLNPVEHTLRLVARK